ncbi:LPXTG cell wall anchor domain-containing protein [Corynebacterium aquilae]|uniref:Gram-positive cocci surface proteins LPxTG domain-containing protein n=1 Tax=Corynebacterium aquilae DSM 44791 TaxID=1431546 RepID=A0A1L7CHA6_9CORY|nr:LPXTG cell wall anchor domain-containing protein [Corynebacterium aquilae]APT85226.1 hypothetical protein CAQU_09240 [Corynebacterium aquilae DSM 44791]
MTHGKKWRSAVLAAATAAAMLSVSPSAMADTEKVVSGVSVDASKLNVAAIDMNRTINLKIIKKVSGDRPVAGVQFRLQRLEGFDLSTTENWQKAFDLKVADAARGPFVGSPIDITTNADGEATATNLARGVYYVVELEPTTVDGEYVNSAPFVITLPTGNPEGTAWNYDVSVKAKNQPRPTYPDHTPPPPVPGPGPEPTPSKTTTPTKPTSTKPTPSKTTVTTTPSTKTKTTTPRLPDEETVTRTTTTKTTTTDRPGTPGEENVQRKTPNTPEAEKSVPRRVRESLASTGASVIGVVIAGSLLVIGGIFLASRRRKTDEA